MKNLRIRDIVRPVVLLLVALTGALCLLVGLRNSPLALMLAGGLIPLVGFVAWRVCRRIRMLHSHAWFHANNAAEAERHYFEVLRGIVQVVEARDGLGATRCERIGRLAERSALNLGLPPARAALLGMVAQVHDVGLLAVPERVLQRPGALLTGELRTVQRHPEIGHRVLAPLTFLAEVLDAVRYHHERLNGTGYPKGLKGEQIPLVARILAVAETFDAITHDRPYGRAISSPAALAELVRCADTGYDRRCVIALARAINLAELLPAEWLATPTGAQPAAARPTPAEPTLPPLEPDALPTA